MEVDATATRRGFLKRAALFLGSLWAALVLREGEALAIAADSAEKEGERTLKFYGRHWHLFSPAVKKGQIPAKGDQLVVYGELLDGPQGVKRGEFYSNCLCVQSPFGSSSFAAGQLEVHTFNLEGGTILGMGASKPTPAAEDVYTVTGGTGRFAGVTGTYTARQDPLELGGDGTAEIVFRLKA